MREIFFVSSKSPKNSDPDPFVTSTELWIRICTIKSRILNTAFFHFSWSFFDFFLYVLNLTLLHLPTLRFHCVGGCWDRTQDCCEQLDALTTRLDLIFARIRIFQSGSGSTTLVFCQWSRFSQDCSSMGTPWLPAWDSKAGSVPGGCCSWALPRSTFFWPKVLLLKGEETSFSMWITSVILEN